jgi:hypothetical protein
LPLVLTYISNSHYENLDHILTLAIENLLSGPVRKAYAFVRQSRLETLSLVQEF